MTPAHKMKYLDLTLPTPQENLAFDDELLDAAERGDGGETLRVWESPEHFVVVGYGNKIETEVNAAACAARKIPVLRRSSGGGTVLLGPGCLNYALILKFADNAELRNVSAANRFIMERNRAAIQSAVHNPQSAIEAQSHTDLTLDGKKFSGNAQRRRRRFILFHGTFLLDFDLASVGELLRHPSREPDYRGGRAHEKFLINLDLCAAEVKAALRAAWCG